MPLPRRVSGHCPRPSWHSPGSRARVTAPRSRSAALRHAAARARRRQQRLPILCQRCSPGVPRGGGAGPGPAPAAPRPIPKRSARGCEGFLARVAGPPGTLARRTAEVGKGRSAGLVQSPCLPLPPHPAHHHIDTYSLSTGGWRLGGGSPVAPSPFAVRARGVRDAPGVLLPRISAFLPPGHPAAGFPQVSPGPT